MQIPTAPRYNAAHDLLERNLRAGRGPKIAYRDDRGTCSFQELADRASRFAGAVLGLGIEPEQRVLLCLLDSIDWPVAFLGCIKAGVIPVAANPLLRAADYEYLLHDSRARALVVSGPLLPSIEPIAARSPLLKHVIVAGESAGPRLRVTDLLERSSPVVDPAPTVADEACFWLYSSGSTGPPKGTIHAHSSLVHTADLYAKRVLGIREDDVVFSAAKLFFAYGLGNSLTFPLSVGATTVLTAERATPDSVFARIKEHRPTLFFGVPTLYGAMLASPSLPAPEETGMRLCVSAGESLPKEIGERWTRHFGTRILDGIGSTEMLHIFMSNRPDDNSYGTTGVPVPGYEVRLVDEQGQPVPPGEIGELEISGPTSALCYWNKREKSRETFRGRWTRSGDKFHVDAHGHYVYAGRSDDMLKVSGLYVSPVEVESALIAHPAVVEAAVVGRPDPDGLTKPLAFVVLAPGYSGNSDLTDTLQRHVKSLLAPHKYPRWIAYVAELPRTASGKIQRFRLREEAERSTDEKTS
jgi:benzoate-CoA ligase